MPAEKLQGCLDELKQKLQKINLTSRSTEISDTASHPGLKHQKKAHHDDPAKEEVLDSDADSTSDNNDLSRSPQSSNGKTLLCQRCSLPLIYSIMSSPSIDDQGGEVWGYVCMCIL